MEILKQTLYPKTTRFGNSKKIVITEKLDGSNLGLFRLNDSLIVAQRNNVFHYNPETKETNLNKNNSYKGLIGWLDENGRALYENLHNFSGVFGEWIGMGKIKYGDSLDKKFYIFAKANINEDFTIKNLYYDLELFVYPFLNMEIYSSMGVVPRVCVCEEISLEKLNQLYLEYTKEVGRDVEGFVVNENNQIRKYVRMKNGTLTDHKMPN